MILDDFELKSISESFSLICNVKSTGCNFFAEFILFSKANIFQIKLECAGVFLLFLHYTRKFKSNVFYITIYQGLKEFHLLAHMGCYCKIMVFSQANLKSYVMVFSSYIPAGTMFFL